MQVDIQIIYLIQSGRQHKQKGTAALHSDEKSHSSAPGIYKAPGIIL